MNAILQGINETREAIKMYSCWLYLGFQDIKLRYIRSILGPWWLTISTGIFITVVYLLWSKIQNNNTENYLTYFACGHIIWIYISSQILDSSNGFSQYSNTIKQIRLPFPLYILRISVKNFVIFLHNFLIIIIILLIYPPNNIINTIILVPALILIQINIILLMIIVFIICTRYRDLTQIIANIIQLMYFFTPILWREKNLENYSWVFNFNPFYHLISLIRSPLLGELPSLSNWLMTIVFIFVQFILSMYLLGKYSKKIAYWI